MLNRFRRELPDFIPALFLLAFALSVPQPAYASAQPVNLVNVNTATVAELQLLPNVGAVLAARIVAGRPYASPVDLEKVRGLGGDKHLAAILPYVTTHGATTLHAKVQGPKRGPTPKPAASLDSQRTLSLYSPVAQQSIRRGLADGSVRFEPSASGGEYIWFPDGAR